MHLTNRLYFILLTILILSFGLIVFSFLKKESANRSLLFCPFKKITGIACPSCGTTRSIVHILNGKVRSGLLTNPLGLVALLTMFFVSGLLSYDFLTKQKSLLYLFAKAELLLQRKYVAIPCLILVALNWVWGIIKGL